MQDYSSAAAACGALPVTGDGDWEPSPSSANHVDDIPQSLSSKELHNDLRLLREH